MNMIDDKAEVSDDEENDEDEEDEEGNGKY